MSSHEWQPAGPDDKRSPCPALNCLANHGYLPRNGRDITPGQLEKVLRERLNVSWSISAILTRIGFLSIGKTCKGKMDLDDLFKHNAIEHDASLTRNDFALGESHQINPELIDQLLALSVDGKIGLRSMIKGSNTRIQNSREFNKKFTYGIKQKILIWGEMRLSLLVLGKDTNSEVDVKQMECFLKEERLPEGWKKATSTITQFNLFSLK